MNFSPFAHITPSKSLSLSRAGATLLLAAASVVGIGSSKAFGALVFAQNDPSHVSDGRLGASQDKVRQFQIDANLPGIGLRTLNGTATPYGDYTLVSYHYFGGLINNNVPFTLKVATGPSTSERTQVLDVTSYLKHPTKDLAILSHDPVNGATVPNIAPPSQNIKFYDFGNYAYVGDTSQRNDGQPRAWNNINYNSYDFEGQLRTSAIGVSLQPGSGLQFSSSSSGWNVDTNFVMGSNLSLSLLLDSGVQDLTDIGNANSSVVLYNELSWLRDNTPLNQNIPEPSILSLFAAAIPLLARRSK